jgi:hypothetical protein
MTDMNPYLARLDMYRAAEGRLMSEFYCKQEIARMKFEKDGFAIWPDFPTSEQIIDEALKIKAFVDTK